MQSVRNATPRGDAVRATADPASSLLLHDALAASWWAQTLRKEGNHMTYDDRDRDLHPDETAPENQEGGTEALGAGAGALGGAAVGAAVAGPPGALVGGAIGAAAGAIAGESAEGDDEAGAGAGGGAGAVTGALIGGAVAGPPGAVVGGAVGAGAGAGLGDQMEEEVEEEDVKSPEYQHTNR